MSNNIKPDRLDFIRDIKKIACLPDSDSTSEYLTRQQLIELAVYLTRQNQIIDELRRKVTTTREES